MLQSDAIRAWPDHAWMLDLLYGGKPSVAWATAGSLPAGYDLVEQLVELPSAQGRSFLVSTGTRRGAASALTSFNALRSGRRRVARRVLGTAMRMGLAQPFLRTRIDIGVLAGTSPERRTDNLLTEHLHALLATACPDQGQPDRGRLVLAITGGAGPYRKPVLQVFSGAGRPLGFVKVGWNEWTRAGVHREALALRACADRSLGFGVPELLGLSDWHGLSLLMTAPLPDRARGIGASPPLPGISVLREISQLARDAVEPLASSAWWRGVRSRIRHKVTDSSAREALDLLACKLEADYGAVLLEFCFCHGDFTPWNLARVDARLYLWDWENSSPDAPLGFDAVHYHFQIAFVGRGLPLTQAAEIAARLAQPALRELRVPAENCALLTVLHLTELFLQHEEARSATGAADDRFYPVVTEVLGQRLARIRQPARGVGGRTS